MLAAPFKPLFKKKKKKKKYTLSPPVLILVVPVFQSYSQFQNSNCLLQT